MQNKLTRAYEKIKETSESKWDKKKNLVEYYSACLPLSVFVFCLSLMSVIPLCYLIRF